MGSFNCLLVKTISLALALLIAAEPAHAKKPASVKSPEISSIRLFTEPANPVCGEPVHLVAEIHATAPGKVDFTLHRRIGRNQKASLTIDSSEDGYAQRWHKEFVYRTAIKREYMVVVTGSKYSTEWIPVDVRCGVNG